MRQQAWLLGQRSLASCPVERRGEQLKVCALQTSQVHWDEGLSTKRQTGKMSTSLCSIHSAPTPLPPQSHHFYFFLKNNVFPTPLTNPTVSEQQGEQASQTLPMSQSSGPTLLLWCSGTKARASRDATWKTQPRSLEQHRLFVTLCRSHFPHRGRALQATPRGPSPVPFY